MSIVGHTDSHSLSLLYAQNMIEHIKSYSKDRSFLQKVVGLLIVASYSCLCSHTQTQTHIIRTCHMLHVKLALKRFHHYLSVTDNPSTRKQSKGKGDFNYINLLCHSLAHCLSNNVAHHLSADKITPHQTGVEQHVLC